VTLDQLTPAEINQIDTNQSNAIDGAAGGEYAPTNPIGFSNDIEIKSGADLIIESGGKLVANAGSAVELSADLDMLAGADIELGANSEIKTTNARACIMPLHIEPCRAFNTTMTYTTAGGSPLDWGVTDDGVPQQWQRTEADEWIVNPIPPLPPSATITGFEVYIKPDPTHSSVPATMPAVRLVKYDGGTPITSNGGRSVVATATDASVLLAYNDPHAISATGLTEDVDAVSAGAFHKRRYRLEFRGEYSTNSMDDLLLLCAQITYTTTRVNHQWHEYTLA
jgi:hypothetical protein